MTGSTWFPRIVWTVFLFAYGGQRRCSRFFYRGVRMGPTSSTGKEGKLEASPLRVARSREISGWSFAMSTKAGFWSRFEERVRPFNLLQHPFYQAWSKGELTREDLREYATEYWHHVSAFPTYLSALHSRLPDGEVRREVLRNLTEEEGVDATTARPHSDLWMDFATGMGASRH